MTHSYHCFSQIVFQVQQYLQSGEYGLSIDTDLSLWLESREFNNKPPLRTVYDFVIVNSSLHSEFDEFKSEMTDREYSVLPTNTLLEYWNTFERNSPQPTTMLFGKHHHKLHCTEVDQLCEWVMKQRDKVVMLHECSILYYIYYRIYSKESMHKC